MSTEVRLRHGRARRRAGLETTAVAGRRCRVRSATGRLGRTLAIWVTVVAGLACLAGPAVAGVWTVAHVPLPQAAGSGPLTSVSCPSGRWCLALDGGIVVTWNGTQWTRQSVSGPDPDVTQVSCVSSRSCVAVGTDLPLDSNQPSLPTASIWNGTRWITRRPPAPPGGAMLKLEVSSVSCSSSTSCMLVGTTTQPQPTAFAEFWNGRRWTLQTLPAPAGTVSGSLNAVSCPSARSCLAVGGYAGSSGSGPLVEQWTGTRWFVASAPSSAPLNDLVLTSVSCPQASACLTLGSGYDASGDAQLFSAAWDGTSWTPESLPAPAGATSIALQDVSCVAASACSAVGSDVDTAAATVPLAEAWNGTNWTLQSPAIPASGGQGQLSSVACAASICTAVGSATTSGGGAALAEVANEGGWGLASVPPILSTAPGDLTGISCASSTACVVVGGDGSGSATAPVAVVWNFWSWALRSPQVPFGAQSAQLASVACPVVTVCMSVGDSDGSAPDTEAALGELWNGGSWAPQSLAAPAGATQTALASVSCPSATDCIAVGNSVDPTGDIEPLAEAWNGQTWTVQAMPATTAPDTQLYGVDCPSTRFCVAVGTGTLIETWNGATWTTAPPPASPYNPGALLQAVTCSSTVSCTAVGRDGNSAPLAVHWNGTAWTIQATPTQAGLPTFTAVSCSSGRDCTAVGYAFSGADKATLAEHWNGTTWTLQPTPSVSEYSSGPGNFLQTGLGGVACTTAFTCTATGEVLGAPRVEHYW